VKFKKTIISFVLLSLLVLLAGCSNEGELIQLNQADAEKLYEEENGQFFMYFYSHEGEFEQIKPIAERAAEETSVDIKYFIYDDVNAVGYDDESVDYENRKRNTAVDDLSKDHIYYLEGNEVIDKINFSDFYDYDLDQLHPRMVDFLERY
jgi:hypothetical protein